MRGEAIDENGMVELNPEEFFKSFEVEGGLSITAILMNLCFLLQTAKHEKFTEDDFINDIRICWENIEKMLKVSKYQ